MLIGKDLIQQCFHGSVEDKQQRAEDIYRQYGYSLLLKEDLAADLEVLKKYAELLNTQMEAMRMGEACVKCASNKGGGCCSLYMSGETDVIQLLMNLLVGVDVKKLRNDEVECCFLGRKGCLFLFKPMFCLNYNCRKIHDAVSSEDMYKLEKLTGQLLRKQYEIEGKLLDNLKELANS